MRQKPTAFAEIDNHQTTTWFDNATHLGQSRAFQVGRQVVHHQAAEGGVDTRVWEGQSFDPGDSEIDLHVFAGRFATCDCDHLAGRVDAKHLPIGPDAGASSSSDGACATADLEDAVARPQVREVNGPLAHDSGAAERQQRDHEVITRRPTDQMPVGGRVCLRCVAVTVSGGHAALTGI